MAYLSGRKSKRAYEEEQQQKEEEAKLKERPGDIDLEKLQKAYVALEEAHQQIRETHIEMMLNFAIAAEYKDADTGNHILRISDYATEIAKELGLPHEEIEILRYAAPMHDIGKIGIPDSILQKPGKLTPEEWEIMKQHPLIGQRIFQNSKSPILRAASDIAGAHHEKYDGSGYPRGLKGEAIPLFARIVALVDVFDAVLSKRCYKEKWKYEEGLAYIKELSGTHLDPKLVDIFIKIQPKIKNIYDANRSIEEFLKDFKDESDDLLLGENK